MTAREHHACAVSFTRGLAELMAQTILPALQLTGPGRIVVGSCQADLRRDRNLHA